MSQTPLFDRYNAPAAFGGATFEPAHDDARLTSQLARVRTLMLDGRWRTLAHIAQLVQGSEAGVSARLRDLRRMGLTVRRQPRGQRSRGLWEYQVQESKESA